MALSYEVTLMFCYFGFIVDCCLFLHVYSMEYNILRPSFGPIKLADVVKECYFYANSFYLRGDFSSLIFLSSLLFHLKWMHTLSAPYMWGIYSYKYVAMQQRHFYLSRIRQDNRSAKRHICDVTALQVFPLVQDSEILSAQTGFHAEAAWGLTCI